MTNLHDNKKLDELLTALGLEPGLFWARAAILKWLHSADVEPSAARCVSHCSTCGTDYDPTKLHFCVVYK